MSITRILGALTGTAERPRYSRFCREYAQFVADWCAAGKAGSFYLVQEPSDLTVYEDRKVIEIDENQYITPGFGAGSNSFVIFRGAHVKSANHERGWGGWRHGFGHHTLHFAYPDPSEMTDHEREYFESEVKRRETAHLPVYTDVLACLEENNMIPADRDYLVREPF
ncbi:hypothetical protein C882_0487 [Caenispirillum salinarum AK4]|uniref:Uncharacterized protein n=1 Tax=Caenispirillum salinarum AK4 TaxID=1238182 RepID=K9GT91_9PROT|nr:hypothetical protein [Caenispirillum salinarum]EKV29180.1 hypothetical protein C882_0487 [Caenispirillum salinarum AK4]